MKTGAGKGVRRITEKPGTSHVPFCVKMSAIFHFVSFRENLTFFDVPGY
jgi:hypothetical protein